jgi:hypothetical protein
MAGMERHDPAYDWVDDEELSAEETLQRFEALSPESVELPSVRHGALVVSIASVNQGTGASSVFVEQVWPAGDVQAQLVS